MIGIKVRCLITVLLIVSSVENSLASDNNSTVPDWENPQIISRNKVDGHAFIRPFANKANATNKNSSNRIQSLNGKWQFNWVGHPDKRPTDFYKSDYDVSQWAKIDVPGNWQTQGYGRPIYTNHPYPFAKDQPRVMTEPPANYTNFYDRNPVGSYKRKFIVENGLLDKQVFIEFQGVKSAFYLWVNGKKVGYSQGSMTPAEFDITKYLVNGENDLAVEVYRWSDGSYLEGQDMWRFSGIFRGVSLIARPQVYLQDFLITTDLKNDYQDAQLTVDFELDSAVTNTDFKGYTLQMSLFSPEGKLLAKQKANSKVSNNKQLGKLSLALKDVSLWSAESPVLYSMMLAVLDENGKTLEYIPWSFGFKESKVEDNQFWVNGKSIKIKGVNRHEHHPRMGRTVDLKTMELDIKLMKQGNFNLVRTSHYPNDHRWYQLANEYGLYVLDDANQESHGYKTRNKILGDNPDWTIAHVDRATSMVHTNKNYSAIVIWSLGNEGGAGRNFTAMRDAILAIDKTRPILSDTDPSASDFVERSYRTLEGKNSVDEFIKISDKTQKPFIQREYAHAMGNSLGNFQEHWDKIYAHDNYVGGAIWDWVDQGLARLKNTAMVSYGKDPTKLSLNPKREVWSYGGDFGDSPTDAEFLLNGIVSSDRKPFPSYYEAKKVHQNVWFEQTSDPLIIKVSNRFDFTDLNVYDYVWQVKSQEKGQSKVIAKGKLTFSLAPGKSTLVKVPFTYGGNTSANELLLELSAHTKEDNVWSNKGFELAFEQFVLAAYQYPVSVASTGKKVKVKQTDDAIAITTNNTTLSIDSITGELTSYQVAGQELLVEPLAPYFWKPVNNNQARNKFIERMAPWLNAAAYRQVSSVKVKQISSSLVEVNVLARLVVNNALYQLTYRINGEGEVQVTGNYTPDPARIQHKFMPKFGMRLALDKSLSNINWYGRGPFENYPDRKTAAKVGNYQKTLATFQVAYVSATDSTNRSDVRNVSFSNDKVKLNIQGLQPFNFRAWPYNESDLYSTSQSTVKNDETDRIRRKHYYDLPERGYINVNLDLKIHGVGGDNSWGGKTMKKYFVRADKPLSFAFILKAKSVN
ncbi:glycoside hydrolase family 2 TIM barrel-domain containing protein [Colwellia piezophila]|uniref:glycoside hydrolase family 2 TIM barrel-domain containing protein n=1 Tax=Colwellia piezophila TaxID=211668 RepID=UPI00038000C3|nr:glycoside hydrolase family 2 TIM barrel-domain containing protein [Colwellia piezophila]